MMDLFNALTKHNHRTPAFAVSVRPKGSHTGDKGKEITTVLDTRLIELNLTDNRGFEADQLDLTLDDSDGQLALPSRGAVLAVSLGWKGEDLTYKGEYTVDEISHDGPPDKVTIRARSADMRGSLMNPMERSFHRTTLGEIVKKIAAENQLTPKIDPVFEHFQIPHLDQTNESSINLLQRLADEYDAIATVKNGNLLFIATGKGKSANGEPLLETYLARHLGDAHSYSVAEGDNFKAFKAYWHDSRTGKRGEVRWDENTEVKKVTQPSQAKPKGKRKSKSKGKPSKGREINQLVQTKPFTSDSEQIKTLRHTYASEQSAIEACKRRFKKQQRGAATFSLTLAEGRAELMPETPVRLLNFKEEIDNLAWIITKVTHNLTKSRGFTTAIECELKADEGEGEV